MTDEPVATVPQAAPIRTPSRYQRIQAIFGEYAATTLTSSAFLLVLTITLVCLAWRVGANSLGIVPVADNLLLILLGILSGWVAGLFASPFSHDEKGEFAELQKAIYAFVTGYLVSKLDRLLEKSLFDKGNMPISIAWEQTALFGAAFLLAALWAFIWRKYGFRESSQPVQIGDSKQKLAVP